MLLALTLGAVAMLTNTQLASLSAQTLNRIGFAPRDLWLLELWRILTSAVVTGGGLTLYLALAAVALFVGVAEWRTGTARAAATFWGVHLAVLLVESLLIALPLKLAGNAIGAALVVARDVGPSAGYFGCLGLALISLHVDTRLKYGAFIAVFVVLGVIAITHVGTASGEVRELSAAIAHMIALPLGALSWRIGRRGAVPES